MDTNPLEDIDSGKEPDSLTNRKSHLNTWVALAVALLATFMGVCKVKDDNVVQAMQQAQADRLDHWSYYQARVNREEIAKSTVTLLQLNNADHKADESIKAYEARAQDLENKKEELKNKPNWTRRNTMISIIATTSLTCRTRFWPSPSPCSL